MSESDAPMDAPRLSAPAVEPNSVSSLLVLSFFAALLAGFWAQAVIELLAYPREHPPDYFLGPTPHQAAMAFALCIGFPITFGLSLISLRRVHLAQASFVVGGVTFAVMGALPLLAKALDSPVMVALYFFALVMPFFAMFLAMLYCGKSCSFVAGEDHERAGSIGALARSVRLTVGASILAVCAAYGAWIARPNHSALLVEAALANNIDAARAELAKGARLNYNPVFETEWKPKRPPREPKGPPLTAAIFRGHREMFTFLAERGAQLEQISYSSDWTPIKCAAYVGDTEIVRYLLDHGVREHHWGPYYSCAYEFAVEGEHDEIAELLEGVHAEAIREEAAAKEAAPNY